ncbi:MAG: hypothetical protein R2857_13480 [Vampirovibrionales bacterium]
MGLMLVCLVLSALTLHYGFNMLGLLPQTVQGSGQSIVEQNHFKVNYTLFLNVFFLLATGALVWLLKTHQDDDSGHEHDDDDSASWVEKTLKVLAFASYGWLAGGILVGF